MKTIRFIFSFLLVAGISSVFAQHLQFSSSYTECKGHRTTVNDVEFSPDGKILYSCGGAYQIIAFNGDNGSQLFSFTDENNGNIHNISLNNDGSLLVSGGYSNKNIRVHNAQNLQVVYTIKDFYSVEDICFSPVNNDFAVVGALPNNKQAIVIYNADTKAKVKTLFVQGSNSSLPMCLTYSPDGKYVAAGFANESTGIVIYDVSTGNKYRYIPHSLDINSLGYSPDGQYIAGGSKDEITIWNTSNGNQVHSLSGLESYVLTVDFSPDGKYIVGAGMDHSCVFNMWGVSTGSLVQSMDKHGPDINGLKFSPDGQSLAVALRTYGDAFEVTTTAIFKTGEAVDNSDWYKVASSKANLRLEFPVAPNEETSGDQYYGYYDYTLSHSGHTYQVRVTEYKYDVTSSKRSETINSKINSYKTKLTNPQVISVNIGGTTAKDLIGTKSGARYHYRFAFIGNMYYYMLVVNRSDGETAEETRFFNSFSQY